MFSKIFLAAGLVATSLAAPLDSRTTGYITPSTTYNYNVGNGAIDCNAAGGLVSKSTSNNGADITTLVTFDIPAAAAGKTCTFEFYLDGTATLGGSKQIDLFDSRNPAPGCTSGWGPGNQRDNHIARFDAVLSGVATPQYTYFPLSKPCPAPGTQLAYELVGVNDNDLVSWNPAVAGPRLSY